MKDKELQEARANLLLIAASNPALTHVEFRPSQAQVLEAYILDLEQRIEELSKALATYEPGE